MFITILLLFIFTLLVYYHYVHYERNGRLLNLLPGPLGNPVIGNGFQLHISAEELWKLLCSLFENYYPIFKLLSLFTYVVFIRHPDDLETILNSTKHIEKGRLYNLLHPWLGTGLLTSTGAKWHARRKILTPAFHFNILNKFVDILIKEGDCMTKSLKDVEGTVVKDLVPFISEHTLNVICETAMGISLQKFGEFQQQYRNAIHDITELMTYRAFTGLGSITICYSHYRHKEESKKKILEILHGFTGKNHSGKKTLSRTHQLSILEKP